jgi:hypothetical protein
MKESVALFWMELKPPEWRIPQVTHSRSRKQQSYLVTRDSSKIEILSVTAYTQRLRMDFEDRAHVSNSLP